MSRKRAKGLFFIEIIVPLLCSRIGRTSICLFIQLVIPHNNLMLFVSRKKFFKFPSEFKVTHHYKSVSLKKVTNNSQLV